ncbi:hypothetical protein Q7P37_008337 [Cladosporium fusiforme]
MALSIFKQPFISLPEPTKSFAGKTVIVTGSNTGLGKEAARHIARLGASTLILAVRSLSKGEAAKEDIDRTTGCGKDVVKVWHLDMASYNSVLEFAERAARELQRVDVLLANAAIATGNFSMAEDNESTLTVNVISTFLLVLAMLPKMKETAKSFSTRPVISITSSGAHEGAEFPAKSAPDGQIFATMNDESNGFDFGRYPLSKLLEIYCLRHVGEQHPKLSVTINDVDPGLCQSELARELTGIMGWVFWLQKLIFARSTEYGSRTLVHAISQGPETHGRYLSSCAIAEPGGLAAGENASALQERVWKEVSGKLEKIKPGILNNLRE